MNSEKQAGHVSTEERHGLHLNKELLFVQRFRRASEKASHARRGISHKQLFRQACVKAQPRQSSGACTLQPHQLFYFPLAWLKGNTWQPLVPVSAWNSGRSRARQVGANPACFWEALVASASSGQVWPSTPTQRHRLIHPKACTKLFIGTHSNYAKWKADQR